MKVRDLVKRLLDFEQNAELEILIGPGEKVGVGSIYDDTDDSVIYHPDAAKLIKGGPAKNVTIELEPERDS